MTIAIVMRGRFSWFLSSTRKGLTIDQIGITQELRQNMSDVKERLTRIEEQLNTILALLKPS